MNDKQSEDSSTPNQFNKSDLQSDQEPEKKSEHDCTNKCGCDMGYKWGWLGALILWFIIFTVLFWLIFYSLHPPFVLHPSTTQIDTAKVLLSAVIAALILVILVWLIKAAIGKNY
jgi:hypothetical protein